MRRAASLWSQWSADVALRDVELNAALGLAGMWLRHEADATGEDDGALEAADALRLCKGT